MEGKSQGGKILKILHARAPLRINDIGGWTDTWFSRQGKVLNLAVEPAVEVQVKVFPNERNIRKRVLIRAENYGETFSLNPEKPSAKRHPFLQQTINSQPIPEEFRIEVDLFSPVPAGISTGTSASVCVALLGALNLLTARRLSWDEIAELAHRVETERMKQQSGVQDQICAAHGGVSFIHMYAYPRSHVQKVELSPRTWRELNRRLCLVYLGKPHLSSAIHEKVIALLESGGAEFEQIIRMRDLAEKAKLFLENEDLEDFGRVMAENNECQRALYSGLIAREADQVISVARKFRASGWKVNGAGGKGGSVTLLASADDRLRRRMIEEVNALGKGIRTIPVSLSPTGLAAWES